MIDWKKYFDAIYCIHYVPHLKRKSVIDLELKRVGITDSGILNWKFTTPSVYDKKLFDLTKAEGTSILGSVSQLNLLLATYNILKESEILKYEHILLVEDDIVFVKNMEFLENTLENIPNDFDFCKFDKSVPVEIGKDGYSSYVSDRVNDYFSRYSMLYSTGCYGLSKKAISYLIGEIEKSLKPTDCYDCNLKKTDGFNKYFAVKSVACQITYSKSMSVFFGGSYGVHSHYSRGNLDYSEFNFDGYGYGSVIDE